MRVNFMITAVAALGLLHAASAEMIVKTVAVEPRSKIKLFNGKDFSGWTKIINAEANADPDQTWKVANGVIRCTGQPFGYLATQQSYANFTLSLEYRWDGESDEMNSGIFLFKTGADDFFLPKSIEAQLKKGRAGDLLMLSKATMNGEENSGIKVVERLGKCTEKPVGEWNRVELVARGNTIEVTINGVLQNRGTAVYTDSGQICLQSEGGPIEFRKIVLRPLKK